MDISIQEYEQIMKDWLAAWNRSNPVDVSSFYHDELEYRDPTVPGGIFLKAKLIIYLKMLFRKWPEQEWKDSNIMPHKENGLFSATYSFRIGNGKKSVQGVGMDLIEFNGEKIVRNYVYLNSDQWPEWIKNL